MVIWCNAQFSAEATRLLEAGVSKKHRLITAAGDASVLAAGATDSSLAQADIAFGQPHAGQCEQLPGLMWIQLTSAGYTRYDNDRLREALNARGAVLTNASPVFAEPCAQHAMAMMLGLARALPDAAKEQFGPRTWRHPELREHSRLLGGETVVILGFGAIARRFTELLAPLRMKVLAVRRRAYSESGVHIIPEEKVSAALAQADHVFNFLPENESTRNYVNARRLSCFKRGAYFYNVGRGATVDQRALMEALESGRVGAAYLDVMEPEPLPPEHPLWTARNCYITPHTAGGHRGQDEALVRLFLENLALFERGEREAMAGRV